MFRRQYARMKRTKLRIKNGCGTSISSSNLLSISREKRRKKIFSPKIVSTHKTIAIEPISITLFSLSPKKPQNVFALI